MDFIPKLQQETEAGNAFITAYKRVVVGATDTLPMQIKIGSRPFVFNAYFFSDIAFSYRLIEATISFPGTELTPQNMNRSSATTATHQVFFASTIFTPVKNIIPITSTGAVIHPGVKKLALADVILKTNTDYIAEIANKSGGSGNFGVEIIGYEREV